MTASFASEGGNPASPFLDEQFVVTFLERNLPGLASAGARISSCEVLPIRYGARHVKTILFFDLELTGRDGGRERRSIVGRFTREYGLTSASFDLAQELWRGGFGSDQDLRVCEPLLHVPAWGLVLTAKAGGIDLETMSALAKESYPRAVTRAAEWIAKLHRTRVPNMPMRAPAEEALRMEGRLSTIAADLGLHHPPLRKRAKRVARRVLATAKWSGEIPPALMHGDFLPRNIFFDGTSVTAIDLDGCRLFDPAKDLGTFLGRLTVGATVRRLPFNTNSLREAFLSAYGGELSDDILGRAAAHECVLYLLQSGRESDLPSAEQWLDTAEGRLDEPR